MHICPNSHGEWPTKYRYCPECQAALIALPVDEVNIRSPKQTVVVNNTPARMARQNEVDCEKCGQFNRIGATFNCRGGCGRKFLCKSDHFDKTFQVCDDCAAIRRGDAEQEAARQAKLHSDLEGLAAQVQRLTAELAQVTTARDKAQSDLAEARANLRRAEERAQSAAAAAQAELARAQKTLAEWRARAEQAEAELAQAIRERDARQAELSQAQEELRTAQTASRRAVAEWQAKTAALEASLADWRGRAEQAEGQLPKTKGPQRETMYQPGDILLSKYRIEALAGQGAFARVYRAMHLGLNDTRALKILRRDTTGVDNTEFGDYRIRFQQETRLGTQLNHPHITRVYDFGQEGEALILVMEYAVGGSLAERIAAAREAGSCIPVDEALRIAKEAAAGLAALHERDIVHRDVKPSNLLFDGQGRVKVSDLGLAQTSGDALSTFAASTVPPHPGTPGYMSPEQETSTAYLRPASDVYSLGVVLFEMLTGRAYKSLKPGTRLSQYCADASAWLDELLAQMLASKPDGRPWDGAELLEKLAEGQRIQKEKEEDMQLAEEGMSLLATMKKRIRLGLLS